MTFSAMGMFLGVMEFGCMRLLGLLRLGAIARVTYYEALLQPFTIIILVSGIAVIGLSARLGFFTYNEDFKMYRDVASSFVFLFSLPIMVFASTKVIDEEIENRTMLTLMSKPVSRTQVVLGKYAGVLMLVLACGGDPGDDGGDVRIPALLRRHGDRLSHCQSRGDRPLGTGQLQGVPGAAAVGGADVPAGGDAGGDLGGGFDAVWSGGERDGGGDHLHCRELGEICRRRAGTAGGGAGCIALLAYLLPGLSELDLNQRLIFSNYMLGKGAWEPGMPSYGQIWQYVGLAGVYAVFYIAAVLSFGVGLFRSRELA